MWRGKFIWSCCVLKTFCLSASEFTLLTAFFSLPVKNLLHRSHVWNQGGLQIDLWFSLQESCAVKHQKQTLRCDCFYDSYLACRHIIGLFLSCTNKIRVLSVKVNKPSHFVLWARLSAVKINAPGSLLPPHTGSQLPSHPIS